MSGATHDPAREQGRDDGADPVPDGIPPALLRRLVELRPSLSVQGIVQRREYGSAPRWRVRVRAPHPDYARIHASIAIGGDVAVAEAVRQLISQWRQGRAAPRKSKKRRKSPEELKLAELRRQVVKASGGWRQRQRVRREFDEAAKTPGGLMAYVLGGGYAVPRKPGRPRKYALV